ncbi:phosphotransferase family protein [Flindersiella endophytica]
MTASEERPSLAAQVPQSPEEVTGAWIGACLGLDGERVRSVRLERIGAEYGLVGVLLRARLDTGEAAADTYSVVVKLWGSEHAGGLREARFFDVFGTRLGVRVPRCLHAVADEAAGRGALVLEDLGDVEQGDCLDPITVGTGVRLARSFGALHGTWWGDPELAEVGWLPATPWLSMSRSWLQSRRKEYVERFGGRLTPPFRRFLDSLDEIYGRAVARLSTAAPTLLHDDVHLDNVVFDRRTGEPILLDWARVAIGPGVVDLAELLLAATPQAVDPMLSAYRDGLRAHGVPETGVDSVNSDIAAAVVVCLVRMTCGTARWQPASERETHILDANVERAQAAFELWHSRAPLDFAHG